MGEPTAGETVRRTVVVKNVGGTEANLTAEVPGSVRVVPEPTLETLAAGAEREFEVTFMRTLPGPIREELVVRGGAQPVRIALSGEVLSALPEPGAAASAGWLATTGKKLSAIPPVRELGVTRLTQNEIDLAWSVPGAGVESFALYRRKIEFGEDGRARSVWKPMPEVRIAVGKKTAQAYLTDLRAGEQVALIIIALDAAGNESMESPPFELATSPPTSFRVPWTLVLILLFGGCVYLIVRERRRERDVRASADAEVDRRMRL